MTLPARITLWDWLRSNLRDPHTHQQLTRLETTMATVVDALRGLAAQQTEASAAQQASFTNLQGAIGRLEQAVRDGEVSPEVQAAVDELTAGFEAMTTAATAADDGYEPTPTEPGTAPADEEATPAPGSDADSTTTGTEPTGDTTR